MVYKKDLTANPMIVSLDTGNDKHQSNAELLLSESGANTVFAKQQTFVVKKVETTGIQLIATNPTDLTGTKANEQFHIAFNINNMKDKAGTLLANGTSEAKQWTITPNTAIRLQTEVLFSTALTDAITPRYMDVTIGNENVDITFRIQLNRTVKIVDAKASGVTDGANYQVPKIASSCKIGHKSAFTALYVLKDFVPGNYSKQLIKWKSSDSASSITVFPKNTNITMMEISDQSKVNSFWYYKTTGEEKNGIDLNQFKRMSGSAAYTYNSSSAASTTIRYMFVIDFSEAALTTENIGSYQIVWEAEPESSTTSVKTLAYPFEVTLEKEKEYELSGTATEAQTPETKVEYKISTDVTYDSYINNKSLALVLKPTSTDLPEDAKLVSGGKEYKRNGQGKYIVPLGTIQSGTEDFSLESNMFPDEQKTYSFEAQLYLAGSSVAASPMNGEKVGNVCNVEFKKAENKKPALCVTGERIGTVTEWTAGKGVNIKMNNIAIGKLTVTAYSGLTGNSQVTDLLSSVSGIFTIESGVGTYNSNSTQSATNKLVLSSSAKPGTYRLIFDVKDTSDKTIMEVPYYVIVK